MENLAETTERVIESYLDTLDRYKSVEIELEQKKALLKRMLADQGVTEAEVPRARVYLVPKEVMVYDPVKVRATLTRRTFNQVVKVLNQEFDKVATVLGISEEERATLGEVQAYTPALKVQWKEGNEPKGRIIRRIPAPSVEKVMKEWTLKEVDDGKEAEAQLAHH